MDTLGWVVLILLCLGGFSIAHRKIWGKKKHWACERCGRRWAEGWLLEFDHRLPTSQGGPDTEENAQLLCLGCHAHKHRQLEQQGRISSQLIEQRLKKTGGRWKK